MSDLVNYINTSKKNLLITLLHNRFEEDVMDYLDNGEYASIEELDAWLDEHMRELDETCDRIRDWYAPRIAEEHSQGEGEQWIIYTNDEMEDPEDNEE